MRHRRCLAYAALALTAALPTPAASVQDPSLSFAEEYALSSDRGAVVAGLLAGSENWYRYSCRERQAAGDFDAAARLLAAWTERYGRTPGVIEAENRQTLLSFERDPRATFELLRTRLGLRFDHQREGGVERGALPTRLDPALITRAAWSARALVRHPNSLEGFRDPALFWLAGTELAAGRLHELLARLVRPDVPDLPALIVRDLGAGRSAGFGSLPIHELLRLEHLEECARLQPSLRDEPKFVAAWLERLRPDADSSWLRDPEERAGQLARLWAFAQRLPPVHNSLKAHVLFHYLQHDLTRGAPSQERFLAYLRLPNPRRIARDHPPRCQRDEQVDPAADFPTELPAIGDDEPLLRACLEHLFATEEDVAPYAEFLDPSWLRGVLAETRLLRGGPDAARWTALLGDPQRVRELEQRVELRFPPTLSLQHAARDPVVLELETKNVPTLFVKVFAIDAFRYLIEKQREVDETIELDGLVANHEEVFHFDDPPIRRVRRRFELPILAGPGTFVVEFVGNGLRSRAVIHKGFLQAVEVPGAAGHMFSIFDEAGAPVPDATLWLGGREYGPDERGQIVVPFSTDPGERRIVLHQGERASLATFPHVREEYGLRAPCHVDREALSAGARARLLLRPELLLAGRPVALKLLVEPVLTLTATDLDGLAATQEVRGLALADERELVHELAVPARLAKLTVALRGSVLDLAGERTELHGEPTEFPVNGIDATAETSSALLARRRSGYVLELRGKDGEPKAGRPVALSFRARDFADELDVVLQTDDAGEIDLGALDGVAAVGVPVGTGRGEILLANAACRYPESLHAVAGETLRLPYLGAETKPTRAAFSLLAQDHDAFAQLALAGGFLELRDLAPGDYDLWLHETGTHLTVRVTRGQAVGGWLVGRERMLQATQNRRLQVQSLEVAGDELRVQLVNATRSTRVALLATRYLPPFDIFARLGRASAPAPEVQPVEPALCTYHVGCPLGDEYRYVLERRFAPKFPGNMLPRPSLLLNPLDLAEALGGHYASGGPSAFASRRGGAGGKGRALRAGGGGPSTARASPGLFANLDFLPRPPATLANLEPDVNGLVRVPLSALGDGPIVHVLALDDAQAVYRTRVLDVRPFVPRARHLDAALDPREHSIEQRRIEFVPANGTAVIDDTRVTKITALDSLAAVHRLFLSINGSDDLARFEFVVRWPSLTRAEKLDLCDRYGCHELHFFLHQKDPEFFAEVVRPFLRNKLHKTFLDHWLLGDDLRSYLEPWDFGELNLIERILLAQRLGASEREAVRRLVQEALELRPVDRARERRLFELALANDDLAQASARKGKEARTAAGEPEQEVAAPPTEPLVAPPAVQAGGEEDEELTKELSDDGDRRAAVRNLYRPVGPTRRLVEHDYWHRVRVPGDSFAELVPASAFWRDYADAPLDQPFVSPAVAEASGSFLEMLFALAVLDLPFTPGALEVETEGTQRTLRSATPLLRVRQERAPVSAAAEPSPLLLGENFLRLDERTLLEEGQARDKFVTDEFLSDVPYACQVLVTNPTSSARAVELLLQIPAGALPVQKGFWTRGHTVELGPYSTQAIEYAFYFPAAGDFAHYPVHAAEQARLAGTAEPRTLHVVDRPTRVDTGSWEHVSQHGTSAEVLAHLDRANLQRLDLARLAWRLRERAFFEVLKARLRARYVYSDLVWSYGLFHEDAATTREYLEHAQAFVATCGAALESPLLVIDPVARHSYRHLELDPLVHARAHRRIAEQDDGSDLARQYRALLEALGYRRALDAQDWLGVTYYQLLQERVADALVSFARIDPRALESRLQYDYLGAYLGFFTENALEARRLAEPYREHPLAHWRARFAQVLSQLDEAAGNRPAPAGAADQDRLASSEPALELGGEGRELLIRYRNLAQCQVRYYPLDVEVAFSARPFAELEGDAAAYVQPRSSQVLALPADKKELPLALPVELRGANVRVEVRAGGLSRARTLLASALDVRYLEPYGQVAVADPRSGAALAKVYVKCFARLPDGTVRFHKDGYTDLRGRFDYASVSDDPDLTAQRFAVLVLSDDLGADVRELAPPAR